MKYLGQDVKTSGLPSCVNLSVYLRVCVVFEAENLYQTIEIKVSIAFSSPVLVPPGE